MLQSVYRAVLTVVAIGAVSMFAASSALAVEVVDEDTSAHCPTAANVAEDKADCRIRGEANDLELGGLFGAMVVCDVHLEGDVNEAGHAVADSYDIVNTAQNPCEGGSAAECTDTANHRHPEAATTGNEVGGVTPIEANFCVIAFGIQIECHVSGTVVDLGTHDYVMRFAHTSKCEDNNAYSLQGDIAIVVDSTHPAVEIR